MHNNNNDDNTKLSALKVRVQQLKFLRILNITGRCSFKKVHTSKTKYIVKKYKTSYSDKI